MQENKFCLNFCDSLYPTWDCSNTAETTKHYVLQPQFTRMEANPANTKNIRANFEDAYMFDNCNTFLLNSDSYKKPVYKKPSASAEKEIWEAFRATTLAWDLIRKTRVAS